MKKAVIHNPDEKEYNQKINQETLKRWQEAENGHTVSHEAMIQWLDTWGTDNEGERPL